ncbi:MAG TPA: hypothetical protein VGK67_32960 [Myxococcales bacterium]
MNLKRMTLCGAMALSLAGCPGPAEKQPIKIDSSKAALTITEQTDALAESVAQSATFVGQTDTAQQMNETCAPDTINPDGSTTPGTCTPTPMDTAQPERDAAQWLKDHLFNADHVDAAQSTDTAVVFCLKTVDLCGDPASADCAKVWDAVPVCVRVQSFAEKEFDLAVLVGKSPQNNPFNFSLKADYVKGEVKLVDAKKSYEAFSTATGEALPAGFPTKLEGAFSVELQKIAEKSVSVKAAVLEAIAVDVYAAADAKHSEFRVAAAPSLWAITLDGDKKVLSADVDAKAVDLLVAAQNLFGQDPQPCPPPPDVCPPAPEPIVGALLMHLDGSSFSLKFDAASADETVTVNNIGLGDATSKVQFKSSTGTVTDIAKLDLNASLGRRVSVTYVKKADGAQLTFAPGLELLLDHDLRVLANQLPDLKGAALKAISSVKLTGTSPVLFFRDTPSEVKVQSGTLELKATGMIDLADIAVTIGDGQCVLDNPTAPPADSHPFAGSVGGTCSP